MKNFNDAIGDGLNGYLATILDLRNYADDIESSEQEPEKIKYVLIFGCPSSQEEISANPRKLSNTLKNVIKYSQKYKNAKFIFASSEGANYPDEEGVQGDYNRYKRVIEHYLTNEVENHLIYRIPRVYGAGKTKGLFSRLDNIFDEHIANKPIDYINEQQFYKWFWRHQRENGIKEFPKKDLKQVTIKQLKEMVQNNKLSYL